MMTTEEWNDKPCGGNDPDLTPEAMERLAAYLCTSAQPSIGRRKSIAAILLALSAQRETLIKSRDMMGRLWEKEKARAESAEASLKKAVEALNQFQLVAAGFVSVQSAHDKADAFFTSLERKKP